MRKQRGSMPDRPGAADDIEELIESAEELGRDPDQEVDPDADPR